jgi:hypothetical protein
MWILPNNHPLSSVFAQEYAESSEDLKEYFDQSELPLMWKSKHLSWKTFLRHSKRVWWMRHLSGRILKPSTRTRFETALMESLEVIPVSHSALPETGGGNLIQDTFGRLYTRLLKKAGRHGASLKTSEGTYQWDIPKFTETFETWVTGLSQESIQRKKSVLRTKETDYSSLPLWKTPLSSENEGGVMEIRSGADARIKLRDQSVHWSTPDANLWKGAVSEESLIRKDGKSRMDRLTNQTVHANWGTPRVSTNGMNGTIPLDPKGRIEDQILNWATPVSTLYKNGKSSEGYGLNLSEQVTVKKWPTPLSDDVNNVNRPPGAYASLTKDVVKWPTPVTMDKMAPKTEKALIREKEEIRPGRTSFSNLRDSVITGPMIGFQPDKENISTNGKSRARLNPAWSIQLMGTTLQKIFTVPLAIQLLSKPQN